MDLSNYGPEWFAVALFFFAPIFFYPSIHAEDKKHINRRAIYLLNLLLGWSFVGWAVALVWSFTEQPSNAGTKDEPWRYPKWGYFSVQMCFLACLCIWFYRTVFTHGFLWGWVLVPMALLLAFVSLGSFFPDYWDRKLSS